ncbi:hypothetical protein M2232_001773 [Bradyrhizobium japonicum]|uniref:hypothetical protein n=1 Tax=Bradyrhizobium japonicum TaxID=375 RepID=UPI002227DE99|nr:hypothetical protein [Bradyrhizobium japonicum]MCW2218241.1 hypothetical protein [Bradyrhizobium japonicum]MCW2342855.1 hypothetical protein [Bradyrhizobium japonicum]
MTDLRGGYRSGAARRPDAEWGERMLAGQARLQDLFALVAQMRTQDVGEAGASRAALLLAAEMAVRRAA